MTSMASPQLGQTIDSAIVTIPFNGRFGVACTAVHAMTGSMTWGLGLCKVGDLSGGSKVPCLRGGLPGGGLLAGSGDGVDIYFCKPPGASQSVSCDWISSQVNLTRGKSSVDSAAAS